MTQLCGLQIKTEVRFSEKPHTSEASLTGASWKERMSVLEQAVFFLKCTWMHMFARPPARKSILL